MAFRKALSLVEAGARVTVVAPDIHQELTDLVSEVVRRKYRADDIAGKSLVITCTDDAAVNARVFEDAEQAGIWVNSADDPSNCSFTLPAIAWQGDLSVAVSTAGRSPAMASWIRSRLEREFDTRYEELLEILVQVRAEAKAEFGTSEVPGWLESLNGEVLDLVGTGQHPQALKQLRAGVGLPLKVRTP